jgi:hypothetical protein
MLAVALTLAAFTPSCHRTYTPLMFSKALNAAYHGTHQPRPDTHRNLSRYVRCQRPPASNRMRARQRWRVARDANQARRQPVFQYANVSWYDDAGQTASGFHSFYGVADCGSGGGPCYGFGTRIEFCNGGRCVTATIDDHGPYVAGREWDLNQNTAAAIGFQGVGVVSWRLQ